MFYALLILHMALCVVLVGLVLLQQGKGAGMGAAFGGGSNTVFGAGGAGNVLTKATTTTAVLFMLTSIMLIRSYSGMGSEAAGPVEDPLKGSVMEQRAAEQAAPPAAEPPAQQAAPAEPAPPPAAQVPAAE